MQINTNIKFIVQNVSTISNLKAKSKTVINGFILKDFIVIINLAPNSFILKLS